MKYDNFGRTWNGRKIVWIRSSNAATPALYKWVVRGGNKNLVYDKKHGMYDRDGYHIKEMRVDILPALEGKDNQKNPAPGTWEKFPNTEEALSFINSITPNGYINQQNDSADINDFDNEFDEEILIR